MVFQKERPARESGANTSFQPLERRLLPPQQGENAGDLIVGVVRMPKGLRVRTSLCQAIQSLSIVPCQGVKYAPQTNDERLIGQKLGCLIQQSLCLLPIPSHYGRLWPVVDRILIAGI